MGQLHACIFLLSVISAMAGVEPQRRTRFLAPVQSPPRDSCGIDCASFFSQDGFLDCLEDAFPSKDTLVLPGDANYDAARMLSSIRTSPKPVAVVFARNTSDVVAAVRCGFVWDVRVTVVNGRHAYQGLSILDGYLAIDTSNLTKLEVITDPMLSASVGPGITNTLFATSLHGKVPRDVFGVVGQCPSVGFGGYALGGGMALTSRSHGLACDNVLSLEMVMYNGTVITANATHHSDILWASCGGGGGLGVVTEFVVKLHRQPSTTFTYFSLASLAVPHAPNRTNWIDIQLKVQKWWAGEDGRLAGGTGPRGIFWGTAEEARRAMYDAGLLDEPNQSITTADCKYCGEFTSYRDAFLRESCVLWVDKVGSGLSSIFPDRNESDCFNYDFLHGEFARMSSLPQSPISMGASQVWQTWRMSTCRLMDPPSRESWEALASMPNPDCPAMSDLSENTSEYAEALARGEVFESRCLAVQLGWVNPKVNHILGGAVANRSPSDTAFYYRAKYSPICFDASLPAEMVGRNGRLVDAFLLNGVTVRPQSLANGILQEIKARLDVVYSLLGREEASVSYINYQNPPLANWQKAYFGDNVERLAKIKQKYDPLGVFSKPLIVDGIRSTHLN